MDTSLQFVLFNKTGDQLSLWINLHHYFGLNSVPGDQPGHCEFLGFLEFFLLMLLKFLLLNFVLLLPLHSHCLLYFNLFANLRPLCALSPAISTAPFVVAFAFVWRPTCNKFGF